MAAVFEQVAGFFVGVWIFSHGFIWLKQKRMIENTPTSKIRSIAMGNVEIYGEVVPQEKMMKSPVTGKECVYYNFRVEEERGSGDSRRWVTLKKGEDAVKFLLKDSTGTVLVDTKGAKIEIPADYEYRPGFGKMPETAIRYFSKNNINYKTLFGFNKTLRIIEKYIAPKDKLYIMGTAGDNPYKEEATAAKNEEDIMIQKGGVASFYYISDRPEKEILKTLKWKVIAGLAGGAVLSLACLAFVLYDLGIL
jgi:hypothetical protein